MRGDRRLGDTTVGPVGLGVQMLAASTDKTISDATRLIHAALDAGVRLVDMADCYAPNGYWSGQAERLVGEALRTWSGDSNSVVVATKGGHVLGSHPRDVTRNGKPQHLKAACEASLRALGRETIDLYQLHSVDPDTPIEESVGAMADLQASGKIRMIGLSNVGRGQISAARNAISAPATIVSVQNRFSIASYESRQVLDWCGDQGLGFLPYSPLAREQAGKLGQRFAALMRIASDRAVSPQRVALAWMLALGEHVIPLPGAMRVEHVLDNVAAGEMTLSEEEISSVTEAAQNPVA